MVIKMIRKIYVELVAIKKELQTIKKCLEFVEEKDEIDEAVEKFISQ